MENCRLGNTDLQVSKICLGTMTWGEQNAEKQAHAQMDLAVEAGINFIDTAEMYPVPPKEETYGLTETYIGTWLKKRKNRQQLIIASKVAGPAQWLPYLRNGQSNLNRTTIQAALNDSLKRLQTDYIDLYQLHWPDRKTNYFGKLGYQHEIDHDHVAINETLDALTECIEQGKIRHIGISNETPWGMMTYLRHAQQPGVPKIQTIQNPYNLLNRTFEIGCAEISQREGVGLLAYSPLAFGVLSGKYLNNAKPSGARLSLFERFDRYTNTIAVEATLAYVKLAQSHQLDPAQMSLAYVNSRGFLTSTIIGATNLEQLQTDIDSSKLDLAPEILEEIEAIHTRYPNPCP